MHLSISATRGANSYYLIAREEIKMDRKEKKMETKKQWSLYSAKLSKKGNHVNLTLITGEAENREFSFLTLKIGGGKTYSCDVANGKVIIETTLAEDKEQVEEDLPF